MVHNSPLVCMILSLALAGAARAETTYTYDFDGLDGTGTGEQLDGQDNWQSWADLKNGTPGTDTDHYMVTDEQGIYKSGDRTVAALLREPGRDLAC
jgi:hypothetical protein